MARQRKLTQEDAESIRQLNEWRQQEVKRINDIASARALADKFNVSLRSVEKVLAYEIY